MHYIFCCKTCEKSNTDINFHPNNIDPSRSIPNNNGPSSIEQIYYNISNSVQINFNENINNSNNQNGQAQNQVNNQLELENQSNNNILQNEKKISNISNNNSGKNIKGGNNVIINNIDELINASVTLSNDNALKSEKSELDKSKSYIDNFSSVTSTPHYGGKDY